MRHLSMPHLSMPHLSTMTLLLASAVIALAGCPTTGSACELDLECDDGELCGRDRTCAPASTLREVTTTWTVRGAPASMTSCASHPNLFISYLGQDLGDTFGFTPVPCHIGQFRIDKLPDRFDQVELGVEGGASQVRSISATDTVMFDLR